MIDFSFATAEQIAHELALRIKTRRLTLGFSQLDIANRAGVSIGTIRNLERHGDCGLVTVIKVAQVLRLDNDFKALFEVEVTSIAELTALSIAKGSRKRAPRKPRVKKE